jgi:hypothetical protein
MRAATLIVAMLALCTASCATSVIRSGAPPGRAALEYDHRWHPAFLFGTVSGLKRHDLERACPNGWAEIRLYADPFTLAAGAMTLFIYSPSRLTIVCRRRPSDEVLSF